MQFSVLKKELRFSKELLSLVDTLKSIASSRYHALEREKERFERFMTSFSEFFRVVNLVDVDDPLVKVATDVLGVVIVTSDSGFMGGLNANVINTALQIQRGMDKSKNGPRFCRSTPLSSNEGAQGTGYYILRCNMNFVKCIVKKM